MLFACNKKLFYFAWITLKQAWGAWPQLSTAAGVLACWDWLAGCWCGGTCAPALGNAWCHKTLCLAPAQATRLPLRAGGPAAASTWLPTMRLMPLH